MIYLSYLFLFFLAFFGMEFVAWFSHKYIMHGFLWKLHKDHHRGTSTTLQNNDWFSIIFALPSFLFIFLGFLFENYLNVAVGFGMTAYGCVYFFVHDIFVHQRIKFLRDTTNPYMLALRRAHKSHHKSLEKENTESFGFIIVNKKYFTKDKTHPASKHITR